jgi:serine/threonine-protein kinase
MDGLEGKTIGKYRIIKRLGRGGMATVYKAYHPGLDRFVAIKTLHSHLYEGQNFLERFQQEAKAVAALRHQNIVQVFDFDVHDETYYMVMEFISAGTLKAKMQEYSVDGNTLPINEAVEIIRQVSSALNYAHENGMIHRDVKPSNVLLNEKGEALLTDFGIARLLSKESSNLTATGALVGTPAYISPEQGKGERELTPASDIYSLGVIFYELLTGQVPFDADTPIAIIHKHIHEPLPFPHQINPDLPTPLERVILKALAKDPEDRYQTTREMMDAIDKALETVASPSSDETRVEQPSFQETVVSPVVPKESTIETAEPVYEEEEEISIPEFTTDEIAAPKKKFPLKKIIFAVVGLVGVIIIAFLAVIFFTNYSFGPKCETIGECEIEAYVLRDEGNTEEAVLRLEKAIDLVPDGEENRYAALWCRKGELDTSLGRTKSALNDYLKCFDLAEGNPDLRDEASSRIQILQELQQ